ncbi:hypothetical protein QF037_009984 [Streptomyces canus]|uniref:hypothetical protein n=1 Tax=Streptomyces canus TaxID=58343 RepID=UPI0027886E07|nr:hypothetical protein [Streptomyces canus]MDQ0605551.1 hypothetical protein [Streptomyces canus]
MLARTFSCRGFCRALLPGEICPAGSDALDSFGAEVVHLVAPLRLDPHLLREEHGRIGLFVTLLNFATKVSPLALKRRSSPACR